MRALPSPPFQFSNCLSPVCPLVTIINLSLRSIPPASYRSIVWAKYDEPAAKEASSEICMSCYFSTQSMSQSKLVALDSAGSQWM